MSVPSFLTWPSLALSPPSRPERIPPLPRWSPGPFPELPNAPLCLISYRNTRHQCCSGVRSLQGPPAHSVSRPVAHLEPSRLWGPVQLSASRCFLCLGPSVNSDSKMESSQGQLHWNGEGGVCTAYTALEVSDWVQLVQPAAQGGMERSPTQTHKLP